MNHSRILAVILVILTLLLLVSCSSDDKSTNSPTGFTPHGMALISAKDQTFPMGSSTGFEDERPVHTVRFTHSFWLDSTEVTQGNYDTLMSHTYSGYFSPTWNDPHGVGTRYPAYHVNWDDAVLYCNARSKRDGLDTVYRYTSISGTPGNLCKLRGVTSDLSKSGYRLPTEAEWEYACRGGTTTDYNWGKSYNPYPANASDTADFDAHAVWCGNSWQYGSDSAQFGTHRVGSVQANGYHLYDMAGNVYEWCHDWYGNYGSGTLVNPAGPDSGDYHCLRGGSWGSDANYLRSSNRIFFTPDYTFYFVGFRVALTVQ